MKVLVGSKNPVKIEATKEAFAKYFTAFEVEGITVNSDVSDQPVNNDTFKGALNRALALKKINDDNKIDAQYFVGIEGGIIKLFDRWFALGVICIVSQTGRVSFGTSPNFELPDSIIKKLLAGVELGDVMDEITGVHNTKQKGGAIEYFTKGVLDRKFIYIQGLITALIPHINQQYFNER